jgi:hypothetical protein
VSGLVIIAALLVILIATALWLSVRFALHRSGVRRGRRSHRRPRNGGGGEGGPTDGMALRIGRRDEPLDVPGPRLWVSNVETTG